jgi:APA family basic amino acid/polyamine antiporter
MKNSMFSTKSLSRILNEAPARGSGFKRTLNRLNLTNIGIGAIIGAGIFVLTGQIAAMYAGPAIVISFLISGLACALVALCYAEFASMIPVDGSAYTYGYATFGELFAWIIGWNLVAEYLFSAATVAVGWSGYVISFLKDCGIFIPAKFTAATGTVLYNIPNMGWQALSGLSKETLSGIDIHSLQSVTATMNLPAMFIVAVLTILLVIGISESANFNGLMVLIKVSAIILFVGIGFSFVHASNWHPFIPENSGEWGHYGISGILRGAAVVIIAYIGFDAVSTTAQEAKNPQRDIPWASLVSLGISTILYILMAIVLTGLVSYNLLNVADPIAVGVNAMGQGMFWFRPIIKIAAIAGLTSIILVMILGLPRIFFSMSKDGLLPTVFAKMHKRFKTPYIGTILTGIAAIVLAGIFPINVLGEMVSICTLMVFVIVCIGIIVLRQKRPDLPRPFRTPWVPLIPALGALICLIQMFSLPFDTWLRLIAWLVMGFAVYFSYGIFHSVLLNEKNE